MGKSAHGPYWMAILANIRPNTINAFSPFCVVYSLILIKKSGWLLNFTQPNTLATMQFPDRMETIIRMVEKLRGLIDLARQYRMRAEQSNEICNRHSRIGQTETGLELLLKFRFGIGIGKVIIASLIKSVELLYPRPQFVNSFA